MNLKTRAIEEYEKEKKLIEEKDVEYAEKFAEEALNILTDAIGVQRTDVTIVDKQPGRTDFAVDELLFRVVSSRECYNVGVVVKCPVCGTETISEVSNIRDIGKALVEPHFRYDCDAAIERKKNKNGDALSSGERLLMALRDFVSDDYVM